MEKILAAFFVILVASFVQAKEPEPYSVEWLKKGLSCVTITSQNEAQATKEQWEAAFQMAVFYRGFLAGIESTMRFPDEADSKELQFPTSEFYDLKKVAPSLLAFIESNNDYIGEETMLNDILSAWYLSKHPKSSSYQKGFGEALLKLRRTTPR